MTRRTTTRLLHHVVVPIIQRCKCSVGGAASALSSSLYRHFSSSSSSSSNGSSNNGKNNSNKDKGYQSIGSFHSESVEVLTTLPNELYTAPDLPFDFDCPTTTTLISSPPPLMPTSTGTSTSSRYNYAQDFMIDFTTWTFCNHGAFGGALQCGHIRANSWRTHLERQPLRYYDRDLLPHLALANRRMTEFLYCGRKSNDETTTTTMTMTMQHAYNAITLIQNVTVGCNAVIGGYTRQFKSESLIIYFDASYGSVKNMSRHYANQVGGSIYEIPFQDEYLSLLQTTCTVEDATAVFVMALDKAIHDITRNGNGRRTTVKNALLLLDHTTSNTAINVPVEALARRAKEHYEMLVMVDGAHGVLAQDFNLMDLEVAGVDFNISNCHKWLSAPRGAAILYCPHEELRETILRLPAVIANGVDDGYHSRFLWDGSRDYAAQLSLPIVLDYWEKVGTENVRREMRKIMLEAVQILVDLWHSSLLTSCSNDYENLQELLSTSGITIVPLSMHSPMALVRLPAANINHHGSIRTSADAKDVQDFLYNHFVECPIKCIRGILYARISCHIYNKPEDYERLGRVVMRFPGW